MVLELVLTPIFALLKGLIGLIPQGTDLPLWIDNSVDLISKGLIFFPADVWFIVMGNIIFWMGAHLAWAIIEWVYKKLPGVD